MNPQPGLLLALVVPATTSLLYLVVYLASRRRTLGALPGALLGVIFAILAVAVAVTLVSLRVGAFATILLGLVVSLLYSGALIRLFTRRAASQLRASVNTPAAETSETVAHRHIDQIPTTPVPIPAPSRAARSGKLFICYRRDDSADVTGRIYDGLVRITVGIPSSRTWTPFSTAWTSEKCWKSPFSSAMQCSLSLGVHGYCRWLATRTREEDWTTRRTSSESRQKPRYGVTSRSSQFSYTERTRPDPTPYPRRCQTFAYRNGLATRLDPDFHNDLARLVGAIERILARK